MLRIKELLKEKNMMQKELATAMGVSDVALRQSLKGNPTIGTLQKIADVLGVELWELFTETTSKAEFCAMVKDGEECIYFAAFSDLAKYVEGKNIKQSE